MLWHNAFLDLLLITCLSIYSLKHGILSILCMHLSLANKHPSPAYPYVVVHGMTDYIMIYNISNLWRFTGFQLRYMHFFQLIRPHASFVRIGMIWFPHLTNRNPRLRAVSLVGCMSVKGRLECQESDSSTHTSNFCAFVLSPFGHFGGFQEDICQ